MLGLARAEDSAKVWTTVRHSSEEYLQANAADYPRVSSANVL